MLAGPGHPFLAGLIRVAALVGLIGATLVVPGWIAANGDRHGIGAAVTYADDRPNGDDLTMDEPTAPNRAGGPPASGHQTDNAHEADSTHEANGGVAADDTSEDDGSAGRASDNDAHGSLPDAGVGAANDDGPSASAGPAVPVPAAPGAVPDRPVHAAPSAEVIDLSTMIGWYRLAGDELGVSEHLLRALHHVESSGAPHTCLANYQGSGAIGPFQFKPGTFVEYALDGDRDGIADICSFEDSLFSAAFYLRAHGADGIDTPGTWHALTRYGTNPGLVVGLALEYEASRAAPR